MAVPAGPLSLAPNTVAEEYTASVLSNVYESLVDLDPALKVRPGLAESWQTPDDHTWIFRLRRGVRLHDGRTLEARDVAASLEHARSDPSSRRQAQLAMVRSIEAPDPRTVVFETRRPFDPLVTRLATVMVWAPAARPGDPALGTGPYRVRSWERGGDAVLVAFALHRDGPPAVEVVEFWVHADGQERVRRLLEGSVHIVLDVPAERMPELDARHRVTAVAKMGLRILFLGMDCARESTPSASSMNPFRDVRVRQAVALAIDRRALVEGPLGGFADVVDQIVVPQELGQPKDAVPSLPQDLAEARCLLSAAGWSGGFTVELDFMPHKYRAMEAVARAVIDDLGKAGIRVVPRPNTPERMHGRVLSRDTTFYLLGWMSDTGDGRPTYEYLLHGPTGGFGAYNGGGYSSLDLDQMIEKTSEPLPSKDRDALLARMAARVHAEVPLVPLCRQADLYAFASDLAFEPRLDRRIRAAEIRWKR